MKRFVPRVAVAALVLNAAACISVTTPRFLMPAPQREWDPALERARALAADGKAPQADSVLAHYAASYPGTPGAVESHYWRSLIQVQAGAAPGPGTTAMLAMYLNERGVEHRMEAEAMFRASARVDSLTKAAATLASRVQVSSGDVLSANSRAADAKADVKAATADTKDQDAEIRRLRDELAKSKDELERIKKRLVEPPKEAAEIVIRAPTRLEHLIAREYRSLSTRRINSVVEGKMLSFSPTD